MRIAVGLSGGVDSSVAALLLKRGGHDVVGVSMKLWNDSLNIDGDFKACFGPNAIAAMNDAKLIAEHLKIPYEQFDCSKEFEREVIEIVRNERKLGRTPNPCVVCNHRIKFGLFPQLVTEKLGFDKFATGHYARINLSTENSRFALSRALHTAKDQSYFLWSLTQEQLSRVIFPLGELTKQEVRSLAREAKLAIAEKADSQDFFMGETNALLKFIPQQGEVVNEKGEVLALHNGHWNFTVGQRKGLGFATGTPMYVVGIDACRNRVIVGERNEAVRNNFTIDEATLNWVSATPTSEPVKCRVKVRSAGDPIGPAILHNSRVEIPNGIFGVAPGQSAVFFAPNNDEILCGAVING